MEGPVGIVSKYPVLGRDLVSALPILYLTMAFPKTMVDDDFMVNLVLDVYRLAVKATRKQTDSARRLPYLPEGVVAPAGHGQRMWLQKSERKRALPARTTIREAHSRNNEMVEWRTRHSRSKTREKGDVRMLVYLCSLHWQ